ncbi:plasmid replication, integration and excision activator [Spongiactinospora sp. TRM90649]|uniref:plasmid replication, integration and excision activator n=1 Tax=Spongiactinospora sp. TRM90649 TaxID=3031114 RepID=UPI0023F9C5EB|nr:plasmid replication, integration and excision activator [Spongiactinospora sp. TRM90649]MDF5753033.1 plasmid replication, integration and excision activator [Spongiactinospora sp. TRM90649]
MAIQGPIPVAFDQVFPHGCYIVGEVEKVKDFDASTRERFVQARDKQSGEPVWQVAVMDADPALKAAQKTVAVKILGSDEPTVPPAAPGSPFTPVEFDGLTVTPYVNAAGRLAYSIRVRAMRAPRTAKPVKEAQ